MSRQTSLLLKTNSILSINKLKFSNNSKSAKVAIVGSGPAGFYFAQHIMKAVPDVKIDMYEKLPVPFGLVRYGVAPDHQEVKNVISSFTKTASSKNFRFFGNVSIGKDVNFETMKNCYHAVVLAYGCTEDSVLGIPGEKLKNVVAARKFVGWYNGLPEDTNLDVDLDVEKVVIIGQGNVAIDVARILLTPIDTLQKTDITEYSLERLSKRKVKTVYLVGRRGPLQAAFTIKEFREMTKLPNVKTVFVKGQLDGLEKYIPDLPRPRKRLTELLLKTSLTEQKGEFTFQPLFLRKPEEILGKSNVEGVKFSINQIDNSTGKVSSTNKIHNMDCGLVLRSIGYKGVCVDKSIPFDHYKGYVLNEPGIYSSGWISTGPTGVILTTMNNAFEQANVLSNDIKSNKINLTQPKPGYEGLKPILQRNSGAVVSFNGWLKIDQLEVERGQKKGKPREKIVSISEMLKIGGESP